MQCCPLPTCTTTSGSLDASTSRQPRCISAEPTPGAQAPSETTGRAAGATRRPPSTGISGKARKRCVSEDQTRMRRHAMGPL